MSEILRWWFIAVVIVLLAFSPLILPRALIEVRPSYYLEIIQRYADYMTTHGRDIYGSIHSPLFASALKRQSSPYRLLEPPFPEIEDVGITNRVLTGANPMHDENFYRLLYALSEVTGDQAYSQDADEALKWFFTHTQSRETGLFAWGEHLGWDFVNEAPFSRIQGGESTIFIHEFWRPWALWDRCYTLAPDACEQFARGLWNHQIHDQETGNFDRHAYYDKHYTIANNEYPRHAGFYIETWGEAYVYTKDPFFLRTIETLVDYLEERRHPETGALPAASVHPEITWPFNELSYAISVWNTASQVPEPLGTKLRQAAKTTDMVFQKIGHQLEVQGEGFVTKAETSSLHPLNFSKLWATQGSDARRAMKIWARFQQTSSERYSQLVVVTANRYMTVDPPADETLYPGTFGAVISLLLRANRLTADDRFLRRADNVAKHAVRLFWGNHALPRASSRNVHYETVTRADTLALALLELWSALDGEKCPEGYEPTCRIQFAWIDR